MRWFTHLLKAMLVLVLLLGGLAYLLPGVQTVERSRDMAAAPAQVWPWLAEPRRWSRWSAWTLSERRSGPPARPDGDGPDAGVGAQWHWDSATQGSGRARIEQAQPPSRLVYQLVFEDLGFEAQGVFNLQPAPGGGTRVVWRIEVQAGWNPLLRWFGLGLEALVGPELDKGLARLARTVEP